MREEKLLCGLCPAAYREDMPRGRFALWCSLGGIRPECRTPIVYQQKAELPYSPEATPAPAWCVRKLAGNKVWINDQMKGD